ncbi:MAG: AAA family ATPase [Gemmatimonadaceae bacterium]
MGRVAEALPNLWHVYNLRESPYFQETLGADPDRYPLSLFVGRRAEAQRLLQAIGGSGSSRQAVGGAPGVGKTTLVQSVKADALRADYWATDRLVPFYPADTAESVLGRLLSALYDAILTARPATASNAAMQSAQQLVRVSRLESGGASLSVLGVGAGFSRGSSIANPAGAMLLDGPRVVRDLLALVRGAGARGVVLHLNNLENLSDRDVRHAAEILRSLRDSVLLQDGLHVILAGTGEAVAAVTGAHAQVRSVFTSPLVLEPLSIADVLALLQARYEHLALARRKPVVAPVAAKAVEALYPLFRGDLRMLFKVLEEGAMLLIGVAGKPGASIPLAELRPALRQRYGAVVANLDDNRQRQLRVWGKSPDRVHTQKSLVALWKVSQPAVSGALSALEQAGFVVALSRRGAEPVRYALSGVSRLVFGQPA